MTTASELELVAMPAPVEDRIVQIVNNDIRQQNIVRLGAYIRGQVTPIIAEKITKILFDACEGGQLRAIEMLLKVCGDLRPDGTTVVQMNNGGNNNSLTIDARLIDRARQYAQENGLIEDSTTTEMSGSQKENIYEI